MSALGRHIFLVIIITVLCGWNYSLPARSVLQIVASAVKDGVRVVLRSCGETDLHASDNGMLRHILHSNKQIYPPFYDRDAAINFVRI